MARSNAYRVDHQKFEPPPTRTRTWIAINRSVNESWRMGKVTDITTGSYGALDGSTPTEPTHGKIKRQSVAES